MTGSPWAVWSTLLEESMSVLASICASSEMGTWTAILVAGRSRPLNARAHERVQLDRLALDQHRLERLDAEAVERGRPVEQHRGARGSRPRGCPTPPAPGLSTMRLAALMVVRRAPSLPACGQMKGLKSSSAMSFGSPHWWSLERGADHDHGAARVVDALAPAAFWRKRPLLPLIMSASDLSARLLAPVMALAGGPFVEQRVDGLLQHALFVAHDDLGGLQLQQTLQAVVAVDHAAVEVVQVGGREAAAVQRNERAQVPAAARAGLPSPSSSA